jgi:hypothetical protein
MNFKSSLYNIFVNILIFNLVCTFLNGIVLPINILYLLLSYIIVAIAMTLYVPILHFLTVKPMFITEFIVIALLTAGAIYILNLLIPGFNVIGYVVSSKQFDFIVVQSTTLSFGGTIAVFSIVNALLASFFESLKK